jgi:cell division protease FtsH
LAKHVRSIVVVLLIFIAVIFIVEKLVLQQSPAQKLSYSDFYSQIESGNVNKVSIAGHDVAGEYKKQQGTDSRFTTTIPDGDRDLLPELRKHNVQISIENQANTPLIGMVLN